MSTCPRISIVTPSFNQAAYLEETIRSVLNQDYPEIEYIVVDGASTDGSQEIIARYASKLAWWTSEPDQGQADAINKGLGRATGEIVAWMNSDDYYLPGAFRAAVDELLANPACGLVYGNVLAVDAEGKKLNLIRYAPYQVEDLMKFRIIGQPGVFMRRWALEDAGGLDLSYHYLLDHHLWLRIALKHPIRYVNQAWAAARFHPAAKNLAQAAGFGQDADRIAAWMKTQPEWQAKYRAMPSQIQAGVHRINGWYSSEGGKYWAALKAYGRGLIASPAVVLADWKRILFTLAAAVGINLKLAYSALRQSDQEQ